MNLYEMAREYRRNTALLELRVRELQAAKRRAGQYEVKYRLKQRIRVLNDMINESRLTVYELEHCYDREEGANGGREAV